MSVLESDWRRLRVEDASEPTERARAARVARSLRGRSEPTRSPAGTTADATCCGGPCGGCDDERPGAAADAARADVRELIVAKGHSVDNARAAVARLEAAFADGALERTPALDQFLGDLMRALEQDEGEKLGGKSAEAARFILRAIDRELDQA